MYFDKYNYIINNALTTRSNFIVVIALYHDTS